jgi:hypothetical protein
MAPVSLAAVVVPGLTGTGAAGRVARTADSADDFINGERLIISVSGSANDSITACSFDEATPVSTEDGLVPIDEVELGDKVLAYDETTGETNYFSVIGTWVHTDTTLIDLTIDGESIRTTPEHPFYTTAREWVAAKELRVGDEILKADGDHGVVETVTVVDQPQPMYNLTVDTAHTFFVGEGQWLVHNVCRWLSGADRSTRSLGVDLADRAKNYYRLLSPKQRGGATIAVSVVDGVEVVTINGGAERAAARKVADVVRRQGGIFEQAPRATSGTEDHAERFLYNKFGGSNKISAIGVSHWSGACEECRKFFEGEGFLNIYWDDTYIR